MLERARTMLVASKLLTLEVFLRPRSMDHRTIQSTLNGRGELSVVAKA